MKAAWFEKFGAARDVLVIGEKPTPVAGPGEVLVRLRTSGVNPSDVKKRAGSFPNLLDDGYVIPDSDGAGVIEAVGAGVDSKRVGEKVWVYQAQFGRRFGTAAQYVALDSLRAVTLPIEAGFDVGACAGIPIMTAHRCVHADGPIAGQTVLVTGGAGRVGYYAIQWAKMAGARVIASASNPRDEAVCREAGAKHVFNHRETGWSERVKSLNGGKPVDRVIDVEFGANLPEVLDCIRTSGVIATYSSTQVKEPQLPFFRMMYLDVTVRFVIVYSMPEPAKKLAIADITQAFRDGMLQHRIAERVPLAEIARANELVEQGGSNGCVVVTIDA
ncbi:MAG: NADPH:quinone reductase [Gammaproteobacteria bacterium]|nr:NADPH:quinone reductase [Gammaproteobacteria bacterium]